MDRAGVTLFSKERLHIRSLLQCGIGILRNMYKQGYFIFIFYILCCGKYCIYCFCTRQHCAYTVCHMLANTPHLSFFSVYCICSNSIVLDCNDLSHCHYYRVYQISLLKCFLQGIFKRFFKYFSSSDLRAGRPVSSYTVVYTTHYQR